MEVNYEVTESNIVTEVEGLFRSIYLAVGILPLYGLGANLERSAEITDRFNDFRRLLDA